MIINFKHLRDVKLNYMRHLIFTWVEGIRGIFVMIGLIIHGVFPFILPNMFSSYIEGANKRIKTIGT